MKPYPSAGSRLRVARRFFTDSVRAASLLFVFFLIFSFQRPLAAQSVRGIVRDGGTDPAGPLVGASVSWAGTTTGTATDAEGRFSLAVLPGKDWLVIRFVGYADDSLHVHDPARPLDITLRPGKTLQEVTVEGTRPATYIDPLNPIRTERITTKELQKAACCNLSESFETNASVDVSFTDAVSGAKQLQMLGLDGVYVQIQTENLPAVRGLNVLYGLNYTPGTWVNAIDVGKGTGSVANGYESVAGHINVELQKPETAERLFVNGYLNQMGRAEANLQLARRLPRKWSTGLLLHGSTLGQRWMDTRLGNMDRNGDGFLDLPLFGQWNVLNRWKYDGKRLKAQFGFRTMRDTRRGGQLAFYDERHRRLVPPMIYDPVMGHDMPNPDYKHHEPYGTGTATRRHEAFGKLGVVFPDAPYRGLGLLVSAVDHQTDAFFGDNRYRGNQKTLYTNLIYQTILNNTSHGLRTGVSYVLDGYQEQYRDSAFARTESVPGVFGEYTYTLPEKMTVVAGLRADWHNLFGLVATPRLHAKYDITRRTVLRASAGSGFRVANPIADNTAVLVSARRLVVTEPLQPERAWNYGLSGTHDFRLLGRYGTLTADLYRTHFTRQMVTDLDADPQQVRFYNLDGQSFANSLQLEATYQPVKRLDVKLAYKRYDVRTTLAGQLRPRPLVSRDRALFNIGYATSKDRWKFDFTAHWIGSKRLPDTQANPAEFRRETRSPAYTLLNAQVTRSFKHWEWYVGGENLGDFRQSNPIVAAGDPFGRHFDASMAWGPVVGRMVYTGFRFKIH